MITLGVLAPKSSSKDPYFGQVSLLLHGNGTNGSTTFVDSSLNARTVTVAGNAQLSTAQAKFGSASMLFDGTGDYAFNDSATTNKILTAECWIYPTTSKTTIFNVGNNIRVSLLSHPNNYGLTVGGGTETVGGTPVLNAWTHVALSIGTSVNLYINGVLTLSYGIKSVNPDSTFTIAANGSGDRNINSGKYTGYIDDIRYTIGVARYTSNFTPPTAQFPDS